MTIQRVIIKNFKKFKLLPLELNDDLNILVGDNGSGKSTIMEAIHLALTGMYRGRQLKNELSQDLFNKSETDEYIEHTSKGEYNLPPSITIELYLKNVSPKLRGNRNSMKEDCEGIFYTIEFDEQYREEYQTLVVQKEITDIPIEYYHVIWNTFADAPVSNRNISLKTAFIDSVNYRYQNGLDVYINRIMKNVMTSDDEIQIIQTHRSLQKTFKNESSIKKINDRIRDQFKDTIGEVSISVELGSRTAWESNLITQLNGMPFDNIGRGKQCMLKTELALYNTDEEANIVLIEEPENHLSFSNMNRLIHTISQNTIHNQTIVTTHSSFVANNLGLSHIIILGSDGDVRRLKDVDPDDFFKKRSGYDTLRIVLSKKTILVEGDSDDLIIQKAYFDKNGHYPHEDGIDIIAVGTSFRRFLSIAKELKLQVNAVMDNDGHPEKRAEQFKEYISNKIKICYPESIRPNHTSVLKYNANTLEPELYYSDSKTIKEILNYNGSDEEILLYMHNNKVDCALKIFSSEKKITMPDYIERAISFDD
ncbi:MAG: AAA family ATPase [Candidatus Methanomethylophilus alvus]|nr:AAA family ATPase [Methanomethylophilus alvi]